VARSLGLLRAPAFAGKISTRCIAAVTRAAKVGDSAQVHYVGTLDDGTIFDSSRERTPLEFMIGAGNVIRGFDLAVTGLEIGQTRKARIDPVDAYGELDRSMVMAFPSTQAPAGLKVGSRVKLSNGQTAAVTKIDDKEVEIDLNHELAGKTLTFDVELMGLISAEQQAKATFGMGCFWGPELHYQRVPGVIATQTGYSNGKTDQLTYEEVCSGSSGAVEVVEVVYDTAQTSYEKLLDVFWANHDPTQVDGQGGDRGTQYRSGIYFHNPEQQEIAKKSMAAQQAKLGKPIASEIVAVHNYSTAEPNHQQYLARGGRGGNAQSPAKSCTDKVRCYG